MDLRVSVVLLFIFLTGGYSLKCYTYSYSSGSCKATVEDCPGYYCQTRVEKSYDTIITTKGCAYSCVSGTKGTVSTQCCYSDLCNAADGVYKGSFLLLFSPLLFYFLFQ